MAAARRRPTGAHAAPRAPRAARPSARTSAAPAPKGPARARRQQLLPAVFLGVIGGALALAAALPPAGGEAAARARAVLAAQSMTVVDVPPGLDGLDDGRASRSRTTSPQGLAAQAAAPPVAVPPPPPEPVLPGCDGDKVDLDGYANGRLPSDVLCTVPGTDEKLRADAAVAFVQLSKAYADHFGRGICLTDGYRTLAEQIAVRRIKPRLAARPGTSEHGWGLAVDLACGVQSFRSAQYAWLRDNAESFGWTHPDWARSGGSKPEPWHWEYVDK